MKGLFINDKEFSRIKRLQKRIQGQLFTAIVNYWTTGVRTDSLPTAAQFVFDDICDNIDKAQNRGRSDEETHGKCERNEKATTIDSSDSQQLNQPQDKDKYKDKNTKTSAKAESKGTAAGSQSKSFSSSEQALPVPIQLEMIEAHEGEWLSLMSAQYRNVDMHHLLTIFAQRQRLRGKDEEQRTMTEMKEWIVNWLSKPEGVTCVNSLIRERQLAAQRAAMQQKAQSVPDDNIDYAAIAQEHRRQKRQALTMSC